MRRRKVPAGSHRLEVVQKRFEYWRKNRKNRREQIPERLWRAASSLVGPMNITEVSRELGLEWNKLKERILESSARPEKKQRRSKQVADDSFVELSGTTAGMGGLPAMPSTSGTAALELERPDGTRIRIYPHALAKVDIAGVLERFMPSEGR